MTEHSKFPPTPDDDQFAASDSSIERAVKSFDWQRLMPPPVPGELPQSSARQSPAVRKPGLGTIQAGITALGSPEPVAAAPAPVPQPAPQVMPAAEASADPVVFPARKSRQMPMALSEKQHPIDRQLLRDQGLIVPEGTVTGLLEEFRIVKRQVLLMAAQLREADRNDPKAQRILVCSPLPGEGKTYCSVNLALSMAAEKESEVLLVDADFAKPSVLSTLGLPGGPGLMDALTDHSLNVADLVLGTDVPGLWVLPAGNATNSDSEYLNSARTAEVLDQLTAGAPNRIIIFDSPPALAASPAAELAKYAGQAVVVARADRTGQGALEDAISLLSACPNIQLLLNAANFSPSGRRFGTYYGYKG